MTRNIKKQGLDQEGNKKESGSAFCTSRIQSQETDKINFPLRPVYMYMHNIHICM